MLTLREALQLPCFEKARVFAGEAGLDREIRRGLRRPYDDAVEAADIGQRLGADPPIVSFESLGLLDWLYRLPSDAMPNNPYWAKIETLAEHDHKRA